MLVCVCVCFSHLIVVLCVVHKYGFVLLVCMGRLRD